MKQFALIMIIAVAIILDINIIAWLFNFIDPWLAIFLFFILLIFTSFLIQKIYEKFL